MKRIFIDTNFFLRFLLKDVSGQHRKAKELFYRGSRGQVSLFTSIIVFFELYWVLNSFYQRRRREIGEILGKILRLKFVELPERKLLLQALQTYQHTNLDLEDSYNLVYAKFNKADQLASFDKEFQKLFAGKKS